VLLALLPLISSRQRTQKELCSYIVFKGLSKNMSEEATVNPDGSTTFSQEEGAQYTESDAGADAGAGTGAEGAEFIPEEPKGIDPAILLGVGFVVLAVIYYLMYKRSKKQREERDAFFTDMDGDKFNIKLPSAVDEYYQIKEKCEQAGWEPGKAPKNAQEAANGPHRILAQALMKRCIADIPLVTHIQKESPGMNKLYSQSMCSVKQWKTYQAAEALISSEVEEVRAEADEIEPGWSQAIWRQAMQYHSMLKNRHEAEQKAKEEAERKKRLEEEEKKKPKLSPEEEKRRKEEAANKAAEELLKMEERENSSKKSFSNGGMKKGFLKSKK